MLFPKLKKPSKTHSEPMFPILFSVLLACSQQKNTDPEKSKTKDSPVASTSDKAVPAQANVYEVLNFKLGSDDTATIREKLKAVSEKCTDKKGKTRQIHVFNCGGKLPVEKLKPRVVKGNWNRLSFVQGENAPLHFASIVRAHKLPATATEDYNSSLAYLTEKHGEPVRKDKVDETVLAEKTLLQMSIWQKPDLKLELAVMKRDGSDPLVWEKWTHTALNKLVQKRPEKEVKPQPKTKPKEMTVDRIPQKPGNPTVEEVFQKRNEFKDKKITITGKMVRGMAVMGTNYYHLRDGTGGKGTNDLTVTSDEIVPEGSIVTFTGTLAVDKDIGSGYFYPAMLEKAVLVKDN